MSVKILIQQVESARLKLPATAADDSNEESNVVSIANGMVVFVCFQQGVTEEKVTKAAQVVRKVKLSESPDTGSDSKRKTICQIHGDILVIPQATLGGKLKGSSIQYHNNIKPSEGEAYYKLFCDQLSQCQEPEGQSVGMVKNGVWGARQVLSMDTNGPYSHVFDV